MSKWRLHREVRFDTTANGANVAGEVRDYPVAVALVGDNFPYEQTQAGGADIRFADGASGAPLPHSIEHWDAAARSALIWVKVPVVRGNSDDQTIRMHWGNSDAADTGDATAVFDASAGFVAVWHLNDAVGDEPDGVRDATANSAHGTGVNLTTESRGDGVLGHALAVRHADRQWVAINGPRRKLFDLTDRLTFSAWAWARSFANRGDEARRALPGYETIIAKGDNSWRLQKFGVRDWHTPPAELVEICCEMAPRSDLCVVGKTDMALDRWYHFVGVHDHPQVRLYVDGALDAVETFDSPWISSDHAVGIGNQSQFPEQGRCWDGLIDEARVLSVAKDEHWIKLDYESQRSGQKFLLLGEVESKL